MATSPASDVVQGSAEMEKSAMTADVDAAANQPDLLAESTPASIQDGFGDKTGEPTSREDEEWTDPRLKNYPAPLVAKVVSLHNDPT